MACEVFIFGFHFEIITSAGDPFNWHVKSDSELATKLWVILRNKQRIEVVGRPDGR